MMNFKIGDKVLLYTFEECKKMFLFDKTDQAFSIIEWTGFKKKLLTCLTPGIRALVLHQLRLILSRPGAASQFLQPNKDNRETFAVWWNSGHCKGAVAVQACCTRGAGLCLKMAAGFMLTENCLNPVLCCPGKQVEMNPVPVGQEKNSSVVASLALRTPNHKFNNRVYHRKAQSQ